MAKNQKKAVEELSKKQISALKAVGITGKQATDVETARKVLIEKLAGENIDDTDDDPLEELIEMWAAFYEEEEEEDEDDSDEEDDEDEDSDDEEEDEDEDDDEDSANPEEEEYDEAAKDLDEDDEEEDDEDEEDEEDEEEEEEKPAKKKAGKAEAKKPEAKKSEKKEAPAKKTTASASSKGVAWTDSDKKHVSKLKAGIAEAMGEEYEFETTILKQGATVRLKMKSGAKSLFGYDKLRVKGDEIVGSFFFQCLKGMTEVEEALGDAEVQTEMGELELKEYNKNLIYAPGIRLTDLGELLEANGLIDTMVAKLQKSDARAVKGRQNLEKKMAEDAKAKKGETEKKTPSKPATKAEAPAPVVKKKKKK